MISNPTTQNSIPSHAIQQPLLGNQKPDSVIIDINPPRQALLHQQSVTTTRDRGCNWFAASISCIGAGVAGLIFSGGFLIAGGSTVVCKGLAIAGGASLLCGGMMCECADDRS